MIDVNLLLRQSRRPTDVTLPSQGETSSCDDALREAEEDHGGSSSSARIARLMETILAVDRPRRLSGRIAEDPSQGKIPQLAAIYLFPSCPARPSCSPSPNSLPLNLIQSIPKDPQQAQLRSQSSDPFLLLNPPAPAKPACSSPHLPKSQPEFPQGGPEPYIHTKAAEETATGSQSCAAGLRLSECNNMFQSQRLDSSDLDDINLFVCAEDRDYLSQF